MEWCVFTCATCGISHSPARAHRIASLQEEIFSSSFAAAAYLEYTKFKETGKKVRDCHPTLLLHTSMLTHLRHPRSLPAQC